MSKSAGGKAEVKAGSGSAAGKASPAAVGRRTTRDGVDLMDGHEELLIRLAERLDTVCQTLMGFESAVERGLAAEKQRVKRELADLVERMKGQLAAAEAQALWELQVKLLDQLERLEVSSEGTVVRGKVLMERLGRLRGGGMRKEQEATLIDAVVNVTTVTGVEIDLGDKAELLGWGSAVIEMDWGRGGAMAPREEESEAEMVGRVLRGLKEEAPHARVVGSGEQWWFVIRPAARGVGALVAELRDLEALRGVSGQGGRVVLVTGELEERQADLVRGEGFEVVEDRMEATGLTLFRVCGKLV